MFKYEYYPKDFLLIVKYKGFQDKFSLISTLNFIFKEYNFKDLKKILMDFRNVETNLDISELKEISEVRNNFTTNKNPTITVHLTDNSDHTLLSTLISQYYTSEVNKVETCSTLSFCLKYLDLNISKNELEKRILNLKNIFNLE